MEIFKSKLGQWATLLFLAFIWGSSFILMKRGLEVYDANQVAALRIFLSFIVLSPFIFRQISQLKSKFWTLLAVGLLGNGVPAFLFTQAQLGLDSSIIGILNSLVPLFTMILGLIFFKSKIPLLNGLGILIGLIGAIALITINNSSTGESNYLYAFYVIGATICYGLSVNTIKKFLHEIDSFVITSLAFLLVGPPCGVYLFTTDFVSITTTNPEAGTALIYISILAVIGTALAVLIFNMLIKETTAIFASSVTYLIPGVAVFWGVIDGESVSYLHFICLAVILGGVYLVNKR